MTGKHHDRIYARVRRGEFSCNEKDFWDFVVERHWIWWKKIVGKEPWPWTDDPILREFFFCNIFRDLDTGTIWYLEHVVDGSGKSLESAVWATIIYRLVNNVQIFEELGPAAFDRRRWRGMIKMIRAKDILLNSNAYLTLPWPHKFKGRGSRTDRFEYILGKLELEFDGIVHDLQEAKTLQEVGERLKTIYGIGSFLSLQIYRDLILAGFLPFDTNSWVEVGPGALNTLLCLFGKEARSAKRRSEMIYRLKAVAPLQLTKRGWNDFETRVLTACDIENCLCEYGKYAKLVAGIGRKRYYKRGSVWR